MRTLFVTLLLVMCTQLMAQDQAELAKKLNNPVAALISVPLEYIVDEDLGPTGEGEITTYKATPVIPIDFNENWNLISRTIISYIEVEDVAALGQDESGMSDTAQSFFFSPKQPTSNGWILGGGAILLLDTASDDALGTGKWGAGPTAVALKQNGPWTYGALTHYLTDVAGDNDRSDVEEIFLQPFLSYTVAKTKTTFTFQAESTRDLEENETGTVAIFQLGQMFKVGSQIMQGRIGVRHWVESTEFGPDSTTLTARLTFLFPK